MGGGVEGLQGENLHTVQNSPLGPGVHTVDFCCHGVNSKPLIGADCHRSQHHETAENLSQPLEPHPSQVPEVASV